MWGLLWDAGLPMVSYYALRAAGMSEWTALLSATLIAGARVAWVAVRSRRVTWFGALMVAVFAIGLTLAFVTGDPRLMLAKNSVSSAIVATGFLVSLAFDKPLTLIAFQTWRPKEAVAWQELYDSDAAVRRMFRRSAVAWAIGLLIAAILRLPIIYLLPLDIAVVAAGVPGAVIMGGLGLWTALTLRRMSAAEGGGTYSWMAGMSLNMFQARLRRAERHETATDTAVTPTSTAIACHNR